MNNDRLDARHILEKYGDKPALKWQDGNLTYLQYFQRIKHISNIMIQKGVKPGDRVAVLAGIDFNFPIIFFAILSVGGIVVPIDPKTPKMKIKSLMSKVNCDWLIPLDPFYVNDTNFGVKTLENIIDIEFPPESDIAEDMIPLPLTQDATIIFTSGSEGDQKGVLHTIGNHIYSALGSNENIPLSSDDCWMVTLPFFHVAGIAILFRTFIAGAACYIMSEKNNIQDLISVNGVSHLSLVPTQLYRWMDELTSSGSLKYLKTILLGGSKVSPNLVKEALDRKLPLFVSYGSTEMSSQITTSSGRDLFRHTRSSGKPLRHREIKINKNGEILVRGKTLCKGYVTKKSILICSDDEGWFHTGDMGYLDEEQNLMITGRRDNMFVSGGENIHPEEIEQHLQYYDHIIDVCVVDIPDAEFGARPVAFLKTEDVEEIDESDLRKYLKDKIAGFKIPDRFLPWPEEMDTLKPDRKYLREIAKKI